MSPVRATSRTLLTAAACLAAVAGCTATATVAPPGTQPWPPRAEGNITVTILSGTDTSVSAGNEPVNKDEPGMYSELVDWWDKYETPVTHIRVVLDTIPGGATVTHSEMLADAEGGEAGYDIYNLDGEWVPEFAAAGYIRSLQGRPGTTGFLAQPLESGENAGLLYAAPFTTDVGLLYYRKDLVTPAQIAGLHTFSELTGFAGPTTISHPELADGYAGQFADYEGLTVNLLEIIHGDDPNAFAADGTVRDSDAVTQGLQQLFDAIYTTSVIPAAELSYTESQGFTAFATGKALFMRNWPIYYELLSTGSVPGASYVASHFDVAPLPFPSVLGGQDLAISTQSRHPDAALRVIEYLTSREAERCLFAVGGFPATRQSAYSADTALPTGYENVQGHPLCGTRPGSSPQIGKIILKAIGKAFQRPRIRYYTEFSAVVQHVVPRLLNPPSGTDVGDVGDAVSALIAGLKATASGRASP